VLSLPDKRALLLAPGERSEVHELIAAVDIVLPRMGHDFHVLADNDAAAVPPGADASSIAMLLEHWSDVVGIPTPLVSGAGTHNACVLLPTAPPLLRLGNNLWMQGDQQSWRGLAAVALARQAWGAPLARALPSLELDLLIATAFETVRVFNAITADPDARRLQEMSAQVGKHIPRKNRKSLEKACASLTGHEFAPSATARATQASDLRLAALLSGDVGGVLSAACLLDGVAGGALKQRINRSSLAQSLLGFLLGDDFLELRAIAFAP
jgi:hypothetical protein